METLNTYRAGPDDSGRYGIFGGRFVAETLMPLLLELERAYDEAASDPAFIAEFDRQLTQYALNDLPNVDRLPKSCHRMAAKGVQFP